MGNNRQIQVPGAQHPAGQMDPGLKALREYSENKKMKFEIAEELGIPLHEGYNGDLTAKQAGSIGGPIGGNMVKEMIMLAQKQLAEGTE